MKVICNLAFQPYQTQSYQMVLRGLGGWAEQSEGQQTWKIISLTHSQMNQQEIFAYAKKSEWIIVKVPISSKKFNQPGQNH